MGVGQVSSISGWAMQRAVFTRTHIAFVSFLVLSVAWLLAVCPRRRAVVVVPQVTSDEFVRFDNFYVAFVQCFYVILGEGWVDIM